MRIRRDQKPRSKIEKIPFGKEEFVQYDGTKEHTVARAGRKTAKLPVVRFYARRRACPQVALLTGRAAHQLNRCL